MPAKPASIASHQRQNAAGILLSSGHVKAPVHVTTRSPPLELQPVNVAPIRWQNCSNEVGMSTTVVGLSIKVYCATCVLDSER